MHVHRSLYIKYLDQFPERDPVILAIDLEEEDIAILLIETAFSFTKLYNVRTCTELNFLYNDHMRI